MKRLSLQWFHRRKSFTRKSLRGVTFNMKSSLALLKSKSLTEGSSSHETLIGHQNVFHAPKNNVAADFFLARLQGIFLQWRVFIHSFIQTSSRAEQSSCLASYLFVIFEFYCSPSNNWILLSLNWCEGLFCTCIGVYVAFGCLLTSVTIHEEEFLYCLFLSYCTFISWPLNHQQRSCFQIIMDDKVFVVSMITGNVV